MRYSFITTKICILKFKLSFLTLAVAIISLTSCSKEKTSDKPEPGTSRKITKVIEYYSGLIENSTSYATWPVAKFPVDANAIKYSVKEMISGHVYTWKQGNDTDCAYYVFPSTKDIKNGEYYIGLGRTWCAGCTEPSPLWESKYRELYGTNDKVEITFFY